MNLSDFLIIYLACGAPFGAYYAFTSRERSHTPMFYLKLAVNSLLWPQYALRLIFRNGRTRKLFDSRFERQVVQNFAREQEIVRIQKVLESELAKTDPDFRVYEFRDEFDRLVGLSLELSAASDDPADACHELTGITGKSRATPSERCIHRRNLRKLKQHRDLALTAVVQRISALDSSSGSYSECRGQFKNLLKLIGGEDRSDSGQVNLVESSVESQPLYTLDRAA